MTEIVRRQSSFIETVDTNVDTLGREEIIHYPFFTTEHSGLPIEVMVTEIPPNQTEFWRSYGILNTSIIPISGSINVIVKDEQGKVEAQRLEAQQGIDLKKESIFSIFVIYDGSISLILEDLETKLRVLDIDLGNSFEPGSTVHTIQNYSNDWAVYLTIKKTTQDELKRNPRIFISDSRVR